MAALILEAAREARLNARRVRTESDNLRVTVQMNKHRTEVRGETARAALERVRSHCALPCASPWSGLTWVRDDEALHTALVPVD